MGLRIWQLKYIVCGLVVLPFSPFLYLLGRHTRRKVGVLPDAGGGREGIAGDGATPVQLLVIGESTVAGLGARTHDEALAGQFARRLGHRLQKPVAWTVVGKSGVTAGQAIAELLPQIPDKTFDYVLVGLGGNDVMKLSSPWKWRRDMTRLIAILRAQNPDAIMFLANCPVIRLSPVLPQPIKFLLWELSKLHDANAKEFTRPMDRVFYYHQPRSVPAGFFADGIHPSETGYAAWSEAMMNFFAENYKW